MLKEYGDFALLSSTPPGDTFNSNFVPWPGPSQLNVAEDEVTSVAFKFEGGSRLPPDGGVDDAAVVKAGPCTQSLLAFPFVERANHV